jgi:hypothetical protein
MRVRLTVTLAEVVEGIDLSRYSEGDVINLRPQDAKLLIAGGWAERVDEQRVSSIRDWRGAVAADKSGP